MLAPAGDVLGEQVEVDFVEAAGERIRVAHGRPDRKRIRATVVVLPGRAEFIEKYAETVADLQKRGFATAIFEWRGQGLSGRRLANRWKGHITDYAHYLCDLHAVLAHLRGRGYPEPWLMLGHSMGAHIGLHHLRASASPFAGAVMSAPMFGIALGWLPEATALAIANGVHLLGGATRYAPGQSDFDPALRRFEGNRLTSSLERYTAFRNLVRDRPELALGGVTFGWLQASLRSILMSRLPGYGDGIKVPILVCQAGLERIVSNRAQAILAARLPRGRLHVFPAARHELLLEVDQVREGVLDALEEVLREVTR